MIKKLNSQLQESLVLDAAVKCIEATSLLDFTMAAIAKEANLSMGSIYKHIQSKEDVLVAIASKMMSYQRDVISEVMTLPLTTPEKIICVALIPPTKLNLFSFGVHLDMLTCNEAVLQRASSNWLEKLVRIDQAIATIFDTVLMQSWETGELMVDAMQRDQTLEMLCVGNWSLSVGFTQVSYQRHARRLVDISTPLPFPLATDHALIINMQHLLNIHPWKIPLTNEGIEKACILLTEKGFR